MPKPTTREELLRAIMDERDKLEALLADIPRDVMLEKKVLGEWTTKDVLSHLVAWEQMVILWVKSGYEGRNVPVPAEGYKWSDLPGLNEKIYREHKDEPLADVLDKFQQSFHQILDLLKSLPETNLFTPGLHRWQNKNMLAAYFKSCTSSHYLWARKEINKGFKG